MKKQEKFMLMKKSLKNKGLEAFEKILYQTYERSKK
jgi:hypothetical protein